MVNLFISGEWLFGLLDDLRNDALPVKLDRKSVV